MIFHLLPLVMSDYPPDESDHPAVIPDHPHTVNVEKLFGSPWPITIPLESLILVIIVERLGFPSIFFTPQETSIQKDYKIVLSRFNS